MTSTPVRGGVFTRADDDADTYIGDKPGPERDRFGGFFYVNRNEYIPDNETVPGMRCSTHVPVLGGGGALSEQEAPDGSPVIKVGLRRVNLDERIFADEALRSAQLVQLLGKTAVQQVLTASTGKRFAQGARVFVEGDPGGALFFVLKGEARLVTGAGVNAVEFATVCAGELMGEREAMGESEQRTCSAFAVGELEVVEIPRATVAQCLGRFPALAKLLRDTAKARQTAGAELADFLNRW